MRTRKTACCLLLLCFLLFAGCAAPPALTPEALLQKAFLADKTALELAFSVSLQPVENSNAVYTTDRTAPLFGREADRLTVDYSDGTLRQFVYAFAFSGDSALADGFAFAESAAADAEGKYGASVLFERYAADENSSLRQFKTADALETHWKKSDVRSVAEAYAVSDDCILELVFSTLDGESYLVSLTYQVPVTHKMP